MERRSLLVNTLDAQMGKTLQVTGAEAGMHLVALLPSGLDDTAIAQRAAERGISTMPLSSCYLQRPAVNGLILGYGGTNGQQIKQAVHELKKIVRA